MVEILESVLVPPSETTPTAPLWLSNLDLVEPWSHTPIVYAFAAPTGDPSACSAAKLKAALARALVPFYPLAGRLGFSSENGRAQIDCTGEGALFVAARSDEFTTDSLRELRPSLELRRTFVPAVDSGHPPCVLLAAQVTYLKCGGVALGTALHHLAIDALSAVHFIQTWGAMARGADTAPPFHDRTLLRARPTPTVSFDHSVYPDKPMPASAEPMPVVSHLFKLTIDQISALKHRAAETFTARLSTFTVLTAHCWKCICAARNLSPDLEVRLRFPVNIRDRLAPPLPKEFFGNALIHVHVATKAHELVSEPVGAIAGMIKGAIDQVDDVYVRSVIDYLELTKKQRVLGAKRLPETLVCVVSWLGMPIYDADFGWGNPLHNARAQMFCAGYVYLMSSATMDGSVTVLVALEPEEMKRFEKMIYEI